MESTLPKVTPAVASPRVTPAVGAGAPERLLSAAHPRSDDSSVQPPSRRMLAKQKSVFSSLMVPANSMTRVFIHFRTSAPLP